MALQGSRQIKPSLNYGHALEDLEPQNHIFLKMN